MQKSWRSGGKGIRKSVGWCAPQHALGSRRESDGLGLVNGKEQFSYQS